MRKRIITILVLLAVMQGFKQGITGSRGDFILTGQVERVVFLFRFEKSRKPALPLLVFLLKE